MKKVTFIQHRGARILVVDYTRAQGADLSQRVAEAAEAIRNEPQESVLILARASQIEFSPHSVKLLIDHLNANSPYSRATAVVGLEHLSKAIPIANRLTGRKLEAFDDEEEALVWLASHVPLEIPSTEHVRHIEHDGEQILLIDFSVVGGKELLDRIGHAARMIRNSPLRSVLGLTLVKDVQFDRESTAQIKDYVQGNRPYMLAGAAVGLDHLRRAIFALNRLTGRNIRAFEEVESAKDWLVSEKRRILGN